MNKAKLLAAVVACVALGAGMLSGYMYISRERTGYILIQEVYNNFQLKKDLQKKYERTGMARKKVLDSLELGLSLLAREIEQGKGKDESKLQLFNSKREEYLQRKRIIEEDNAQLGDEYDKEILAQLNQYIRDYGKEKGFTYIFGNDGNGSLMYAQEGKDLTKEITTYVNQRYKK